MKSLGTEVEIILSLHLNNFLCLAMNFLEKKKENK